MITRQIELSLDTARRWYEQGGELRELALGAFSKQALIGGRLPKTWDEYCDQLEKNDNLKVKVNIQLLRETLRLMMDYTYADKHVAMVKLHILRDEYRGGWKPDWKDIEHKKYVIQSSEGEYYVDDYYNISTFLTFQDEKTAKEFLTNFRELIEQAGDLI